MLTLRCGQADILGTVDTGDNLLLLLLLPVSLLTPAGDTTVIESIKIQDKA
jgi:hypothetical protein